MAKLGAAALLISIFMFASVNPEELASDSSKRQEQDTHEQEMPKRDTDATLYMQAKLSNAERVLGGLVAEDFDAIAKGAEQMMKISQAAHWPSTEDQVYNHYSFQFRKQCEKLAKHAKSKDLRAAHFTYLHMSTTCIDCHEYVRPRFKVKREHRGPVRLIPTYWDDHHGEQLKQAPGENKDTAP